MTIFIFSYLSFALSLRACIHRDRLTGCAVFVLVSLVVGECVVE